MGHYDDSSRAAAPDRKPGRSLPRPASGGTPASRAGSRTCRSVACWGAVTTVGASSGVILTTAALARLRVKKGDTLYLIGGAGRLGAQDTRSV